MSRLYLSLLGWLVFGLLVYFPVFQNIDTLPLQMWDESRNAINALEMTQNGNLLIRHFDGLPDMWELNPPLLTWLQATSFSFFGYNMLALRLPICLAVLSLVFLIIFFMKKEFGTYWCGILISLILLTTPGFIHSHIARTGDHDAVLILFLTAAALNYYRYLEHPDRRFRYLIFTTIFIICAVLTKSIIGLFILPGLLIYTISEKKLNEVFRDFRTYLSFTVFILVVGSYYLLREYYNPGYLEYVWNDQLFPRYLDSSPNYQYGGKNYWYVIYNLFDWRYTFWLPSLVLTPLLQKFKPDYKLWKLVKFSFILAISILIIVSIGTKNVWYDGPMIPFLCIISGIGIYRIFDVLYQRLNFKSTKKIPIVFLTGVLLYFYPYSYILNKVYKPKEELSNQYFGPCIQNTRKVKPDYTHYKVYNVGYNAHVKFYIKLANLDTGYNIINLKDHLYELQVQDTLMSCEWQDYPKIAAMFDLEEIHRYEHCSFYVIRGIKNAEKNNLSSL